MGWSLCLISLGLRIFTTKWFQSLKGFYFPYIPQVLVLLPLISVAVLSSTQPRWTMVSQILNGEYVPSFHFISVIMRHFGQVSTWGNRSFSCHLLSTLILGEVMAPHSGNLAWKIPWTEEPGGLQSMGSLRVGHDWATSLSLFTFMHWRRKWQPSPVFLPGESQGRGSLVSCRLWGCTESDTTEAT